MCEFHFAKSFVTQLTPSDISNSDVQDSNPLLTTIEFFIYLKKWNMSVEILHHKSL